MKGQSSNSRLLIDACASALCASSARQNRDVRTQMKGGPTLDAQLRHLEEQLLQSEVRASTERVDALLADDFVELGSSGQVFGKKQIVEALRMETPTKRSLSQFASTLLSDNIALVTYRATRAANAGEKTVTTLRSSIWRLSNGQWQMVFHQGTLTK